MSKPKVTVCPYCGEVQHLAETCRACGGRFAAESRRATRGEMGPWFVRDPAQPFRPGCSLDRIRRMIERGRIGKYTIMRGPTTRQFWTVARHVQGVANLLGYCHACDVPVREDAAACPRCRASFIIDTDSDRLGLTIDADNPSNDFSVADLLRSEIDAARGSGRAPISAFAPDEFSEPEDSEPDGRSARLDRDRPSNAEATGQRGQPSGDTAATDVSARVDRLTLQALEQSLRRTVRRQQRTITILTLALIAMTVAAAMLAWSVHRAGESSEAAWGDRGERSAAERSDGISREAAEVEDGTGAEASPTEPPTESAERPLEPQVGQQVDQRLERIEEQLDDLDASEAIEIAEIRALLGRLTATLDELAPVADEGAQARIEALRERIETIRSAAELRDFLDSAAPDGLGSPE